MATFAYVGRTRQGVVKKGQITAGSADQAKEQLSRQQIVVTSLRGKGTQNWWDIEIGGGGVTDKDVVVFTRQFATMINAGLPLIQCLDILGAQSDNKTLAKTVGEVRLAVEGGSTFTDALKKHPKVFDELYVNMVHAGEVGGLLDTILGRLAKHIEKSMKLKSQVKSAMVYPASILGVAVVVITVLMVWVIPIFAQMFKEMSGGKVGLPALTQFVMDTSNFMQSYIIHMVVAGIALGYGIKRYYKTPKGRLLMDRFFLKLPVVGTLIRKTSVAKFTRTLGTLISSGVPIMEGLIITAKASGNRVVENAILGARQSISEGKTLADPLAKSGVFPAMVTQMVSVGESTGALDTMLGKIADFYDDEVDQAVATLTSLLEPIMMVFLGTVIGFIVIAMYLPIFEMAAVVG